MSHSSPPAARSRPCEYDEEAVRRPRSRAGSPAVPSRPCAGLPCLQDLLRCADEDLLFRVLLDDHAPLLAAEARNSSKRRRSIRRRLSRTLEAMRSLSIRKRRSTGRLLLLEESFALHGSSFLIERRVGGRLVFPKDVARARSTLEGRPQPKDPEPVDSCRPWPAARRFALEPWEKTLASRVGLGAARCRRERYQVLAAAFWDMTYYGFEYERAAANRMRAKAYELTNGAAFDPGSPEGRSSQGDGEEDACSPLCRAEATAPPFDLLEPDRFEADYRACLAARVAELNDAAQAAFWRRAVECARLCGAG